ncbi:MAG: hypothetical protein RMM98_14080, partial [Acidobacteriota bacterium]|nr:hypothetical protein [Acidobacteriota bacterium]
RGFSGEKSDTMRPQLDTRVCGLGVRKNGYNIIRCQGGSSTHEFAVSERSSEAGGLGRGTEHRGLASAQKTKSGAEDFIRPHRVVLEEKSRGWLFPPGLSAGGGFMSWAAAGSCDYQATSPRKSGKSGH